MTWRAPCGCEVGALLVPDPGDLAGCEVPFPIRHVEGCPHYASPPADALTAGEGRIYLLAFCGCHWVDRPTLGLMVDHRRGCPSASG